MAGVHRTMETIEKPVYCTQCHYFQKKDTRCTLTEGSPIYKCNKALLDILTDSLHPGDKVLEVGCGSWDYCKRHCERRGVHWEGIDPLTVEKRKKCVATVTGSIHDIPFPDNHFDYVISNQSIEHWHEYGVGFCQGISEIVRVLKPGGQFHLNAPFYLHGHKFFLLGDKGSIKNIFRGMPITRLVIEEWLRMPHEHMTYYGWKRCRFSEKVFPVLRGRNTYLANFTGTKATSGHIPACAPGFCDAVKRKAFLLAKKNRYSRLFLYHAHYGARHLFYKITRL